MISRIPATTIAVMAQRRNELIRARTSMRLASIYCPSLSENRRPHAHDRRAFFDRDFEIVSHAHRQRTAPIAKRAFGLQLISQFTQTAKVWTHALGLIEERRQSH